MMVLLFTVHRDTDARTGPTDLTIRPTPSVTGQTQRWNERSEIPMKGFPLTEPSCL